MQCLPKGEGRASQIGWNLAIVAYSFMEMGGHWDGFHYWTPKTSQGYDSIWVIVDRLTKSTHFLPVKTIFPVKTYAELYLSRIVCLHGVPKTIVSDRGPQFTSRFWESHHEAMGTTLVHSSAYHPQTGGQTERVNQILEDMLRANLWKKVGEILAICGVLLQQ